MDYKQEYNRVCDQLRFINSRVSKVDEFIAFMSFSDGTYSYNSYSSRLDWVQDVKNDFVAWSVIYSQEGVLKGNKLSHEQIKLF